MLSRLSGTVRDPSGLPVTAVAVSARSPSLIGGVRVVMTDQEGRYRLAALEPGEYEVRMSHAGFAVAVYSRIRLMPGASVDVDGVLDVASVSERANVMAPLVDVRTSASTQGLDLPLLEHLPHSATSTRSSISHPVCLRAPGLAGRRGERLVGRWRQRHGDDHTDGMGALQLQLGGRRAGARPGCAGRGSGQFTGVGGSYALRSGSNGFHGLFEVLHPPSSWVAHNTPGDSPSGRSEAWDTSAQLGGPLREDRAWFFLGYHYNHVETRPPFYSGPGSTIFAHPDGLLKLTASPGRTVRVTVSSNTDTPFCRPTGSESTRSTAPRTSASRRPAGTFVRHGRPDRATSSISGPAGIALPKRSPSPPATRSGPYPHYDEITGIESRNMQDYTEEGRRQQSLAVAWTRYMKAVGIGHELKLGVEFEHARLRSTDHLPGDRLYIDDDGQPAFVELWRGAVRRASANRTSIFVQDAWQVSSSVTINAEPGST